MISNIEQLKEEITTSIIVEHKHENIELKSDWETGYGRKISALANKAHQKISFLIVGIDDKGGLCEHTEKWARDTEQNISQQLNQFLNPIQACTDLRCEEIKSSWIVVITIKPPGAVTYWSKSSYKAAGTTCLEMSAPEIMELTMSLPGLHDCSAQEWVGKYDESLVIEFAKIISTYKKDSFFEELHKLPSDAILERLKINNRNVVRILFGDFKFRVIYYSKTEEIIENTTFFGLYRLLSSDFIKNIQVWTKKETHLIKHGLAVSSEEPYPIKALREALANTVAHAAYYEKHGDIIVEIFQDRLIISNICLPQSVYFANKWFSRSHFTINNLLMETLRLAGYVDELGRGKNVIFSEIISSGKKPPIVNIENAGQYNRWRLVLYDGLKNERQLRLLERSRTIYKDEHKALVANALVLWRDIPLAKMREYIDGESLPILKQILAEPKGPVFYYEKDDKIWLRRWARILLTEGKDSKHFTVPEEENLRNLAYEIQTKYSNGFITPEELRGLADMGHTKSEKVLTSNLLKKWVKDGHLKFHKRGLYEFIKPKTQSDLEFGKFLEALFKSMGENPKPDESSGKWFSNTTPEPDK